LRAVAEWEAEHGAFSADELDAAHRRVSGEVTRPGRTRSA
jgi:hypothetical protein